MQPKLKKSPFGRTSKNALLGLAAGGLVMALGSSGPLHAQGAGNSGDVLGKIGEDTVTVGEIRTALEQLGVKPGSINESNTAALNQVVRSLMVQRLLLQEATAKGWDKKPEVVAALQRVRDNALAESYIQSLAAPPETYPSEAELLAAYEIAKPSILVGKSFRLAQIFVAAPPKGGDKALEDKAQAKIKEVVEKLNAKTEFAELASSYSEETETAGRGGEIGWVLENQVQPEIREILPKIKEGGISNAIRLNDGWHIVKILETREPFTPSLDQVRAQLIQRMRAEKTKANSQAILAKLLKDNPLAINELALSQVMEERKKAE